MLDTASVFGGSEVTSASDHGIDDVKIPQPSSDYVEPLANDKRGKPEFKDVDNPGNWPRYYFRPQFASRSKTARYKQHSLPTGAVPFPVNSEGKRKTEWLGILLQWTVKSQ